MVTSSPARTPETSNGLVETRRIKAAQAVADLERLKRLVGLLQQTGRQGVESGFGDAFKLDADHVESGPGGETPLGRARRGGRRLSRWGRLRRWGTGLGFAGTGKSNGDAQRQRKVQSEPDKLKRWDENRQITSRLCNLDCFLRADSFYERQTTALEAG